MTCLTLPLSGKGTVPARLTLPQPLTAQDLLELEHALAGALAMLGRDLPAAGATMASEHAVGHPDAGDIEYASWMPTA